MTAEGRKAWNQIVTKAWSQPEFRRRLIDDAAAVLKEHGIQTPSGAQLRVVENTDEVNYLVLPSKPSEILSDAELEQISAGAIGTSIVCRIRRA